MEKHRGDPGGSGRCRLGEVALPELDQSCRSGNKRTPRCGYGLPIERRRQIPLKFFVDIKRQYPWRLGRVDTHIPAGVDT